MTAQLAPIVPASRLSKSSLISFITGLLFCVPFMGVLALLSGIVGFVRTGKPGVRGRWMAVVGSILGLGTTVMWAVGFTFFIGTMLMLVGAAEAPKTVSRDFVKALAERDVAAAKVLAPTIADDELDSLSVALQSLGKFSDINFSKTEFDGTSRCKLGGTANFSNRSKTVWLLLSNSGSGWKVIGISFP